jgi:hypothetical protein
MRSPYAFLLLALAGPLAAQTPKDTGFASLQQRGKQVMGVDQYTSLHRFDDLPDGGRIVLTRSAADTSGVRTIRAHLADIARAFEAGDSGTPGGVARAADGVMPMRAAISYRGTRSGGGRSGSRLRHDGRGRSTVPGCARGEHHAGGATADTGAARAQWRRPEAARARATPGGDPDARPHGLDIVASWRQ